MKEFRTWTRTSRGFIISLGDTVFFNYHPNLGVVTYINGSYVMVQCEDNDGVLYERELLENEIMEVYRRNQVLMLQLVAKLMFHLKSWKVKW